MFDLKKSLLVGILCIAVLVGVYVGYVVGSGPSTLQYGVGGVYPGAPSYTFWVEGSTYYAKDAYGETPSWGESANATAVWESIRLYGLTAGRTWKETVIFKGNFSLSKMISVDSYTTLDLREARLLATADYGTFGEGIIGIHPAPKHHIDIIGGVLDGNLNEVLGIWQEANLQSYQLTIIGTTILNCGKFGGMVLSGRDIIVSDVFINNTQQLFVGATAGIYLTSVYLDNVRLTRVTVRNTVGGRGFLIEGNSGGKNVFITDSTAEDNDGNGFEATDTVYNIHLQGVKAKNNAGHGIVFSTVYGGEIIGAESELNDLNGIYLANSRNILVSSRGWDNSQNPVNTWSGLYLANAMNVTVYGGRYYDAQGTKTQRYGIQEDGTSNYNIIVANNLMGNSVGNASLVGANDIFQHNLP